MTDVVMLIETFYVNFRTVLTCCVVGCHNRPGHDKVSFFRVPSATTQGMDAASTQFISARSRAWIAKIHRRDWVPSKYS